MKIRILPLFVGALLLLNACHETEELPQNNGGTGGTPTPSNEFKLSIKASDALSVSTDLSALITIEKTDGSKELDEIKLKLTKKEDVFVTDKLNLSEGTLKITSLLVVDATNKVVMATPKLLSPRAHDASQALPFSFSKNDKSVIIVGVPVAETDLPMEFGYTKMAFGERPYVKVNILTQIKVGTVVYSPISKLKVSSGDWISEQEMNNTAQMLLPKKLNNFTFELKVWGQTVTKSLTTAQLNENGEVILYVTTAPRKIKTETVSVSVPAGGSVVNEKREYLYNADGTLNTIYHYQKKTTSDELALILVSKFEYANGRVSKIRRSLESEIGYTKFAYEGSGKITAIEEKSYGMMTTATVSYNSVAPFNQLTATLDYRFHNGNKMVYNMVYENRNNVEYSAYGNSSETGTSLYDNQINPFYLIDYPDLFLSHTSKNNLVSENKNYGGNIPSLERYKFDYKYDEQGYPELLTKKYRGYISKEHVMTDITEYEYYQ